MSDTELSYIWEVGVTLENSIFECCGSSTRKMHVFTKLYVYFQKVDGPTPIVIHGPLGGL